MKVVVALDSFKGSLSSIEAGEAVREGIRRAVDAEVVVKPVADGGEGTARALTEGLGGELQTAMVTGPLGESVQAEYGICGQSAFMEMAAASGITLVSELDPHHASSCGTGEMIKAAFNQGCRRFLIGIGGSATTEGGTGMLRALGFKFLDKDGNPVREDIAGLGEIARIDDSDVDRELLECSFDVMCDVNNPLCGPEGAVYVFGPQKGVKADEKELLDTYMSVYAAVAEEYSGKSVRNEPGAGAAGGMGFAFLNFFPNARLMRGVQSVFEATGLEEEIKDADIVITGEGRLDGTTSMGKAPMGVAALAKKYGCRTCALAGTVMNDARTCNDLGIDAFFSIIQGPCTLAEAMDKETARENLIMTAEQLFRWL
ncbi:MAG: glycerate kinase [Lachnospiraceae bacterium]|nr:glycerate kinase [Lachnospiraceae bacterium]